VTGFGTLQAGYDQRFGNVVVGGFANYDFYPSDQSSSASNGIDGTLSIGILPPLFVIPGIPIANYASVTSNVELKNTWSVGARLGYLLTPNTLIYGLGGYTEASFDGQIDLSYLNLATGPQTLSLRVPNELHGYFLGAGGEVKVSSNVALRL
jgi:opacity protein-like surface antigen